MDVGINARGPIVPLPLISDTPTTSVAPRKARLLHSSIPEHTTTHSLNTMWRLEVRNHGGCEWTPTYAFSEIEILPVDFEMIGWYMTTSPQSWFKHKIFVGWMIMDTQRVEVVGDITLFERTLRKRIIGVVKLEKECKSEKERVEVLEEHFGIKFRDVEREGIMGMVSQIS